MPRGALYKREPEGVLRELHGGEGDVARMQTLEVHGHKPTSAWSHQKLRGKDSPLNVEGFFELATHMKF